MQSFIAIPKDMINHQIGEHLRSKRIELGLRQVDVGKAIGVTPQQIQKYENGVNILNVIRLFEFAHFLCVPISYFFDDIVTTTIHPTSKIKQTEESLDREFLEMAEYFSSIKDKTLRKSLAELARMISVKTGKT